MKCACPAGKTYPLALVIALGGALFGEARAENWPKWRGPDDNGSTTAGPFPTKWNAESVAWKTPLPGKGCSTPVVWDQRIYLTAPVEDRDAVIALDWTGKVLWQTALGPENPGKHRNGSGSNPSPVTDGTAVFVNFKSGSLAALEFDGTIRWQTNLVERFGPDTLFWDHGSSPVLTKRDVVMARMHEGESWLAAFDKSTGELRWKTPRNYETPREVDNGYTTPLVIEHAGQEALLVWGAQHLTIHNAADGRLVWSCGDFNPEAKVFWPAVATPVVADGVAVVSFGRADRGEPRLHGIRLDGRGDVTSTNRLWDRTDVGTFVPSPVEYEGRVYVLDDRGGVECLDPATGMAFWKDALPRSSSNYYSSPVIAGGNLYAVREDGAVFVASVEDGFKLLAENKLEDRVIASIVPIGNRLLIRGEQNLYCIIGG